MADARVGPFTVRLPDVCSLCLRPLARHNAVMVLETELPGMRLHGDPGRAVGWHAECAPNWARGEEGGL